MSELDEDIDVKSSKNKYLTWVIIGIIIIAAIAVPMILLRQSEPAEATEPTTIEEIQTEVQTLWDTVYGTDGLETKIALQAEAIADFEVGGCTCPDWSGQLSSINSDITTLRTDLNAVPDYAGNITQVNTDLTALSADLTAVEATLLGLQEQVNAIEVMDWTPAINALTSDVSGIEGDVSIMQGQIASLQSAIASLPTSLPRYAYVSSLSTESVLPRYLEIGVTGSGNYPVVVMIYGTSLALTTEIRVEDYADYAIEGKMMYAVGKILTLFIEPDTSWGASDTITLVIDEITGSISYATASVGA